MATEHTCTEIVHESELARACGEYVEYSARRHVAFVVLEELLHEATADEVTFAVTISRSTAPGGNYGFTARGELAAGPVTINQGAAAQHA